MGVLILGKVKHPDHAVYSILQQSPKVTMHRGYEGVCCLGRFGKYEIITASCPQLTSENIYIRGDKDGMDSFTYTVFTPEQYDFEHSVLEFNRAFTNNTLEMEDVIWE